MGFARYIHSLVQVPVAWIVWSIAVVVIIGLASWTVTGWTQARAVSVATPAQIHLVPAPAPEPMPAHPMMDWPINGQPYPGRDGVDGWLS